MSESTLYEMPPADAVVCLGLPGNRLPPPRALLRGDLLFYPPGQGAQEVAEFTVGFHLADGGDEPCARTVTVGPDWSPVDKILFPGFGRPSLLAVVNLHDTDRQRRPTEEEAASVARHVVEVGAAGPNGVVVPFAHVRPGRSLPPFEPAAGAILLRCLAGPCRVRVAALPPLDPATNLHPGA